MKKVDTKGKLAAAISEERSDQIIQKCTYAQTSDAEVNKILNSLLQEIVKIDSTILEEAIGEARYIADSLRNEARRNKGLRYFYYGMYQAKVEQMQEQFLKEETEALQNEVIYRKHFTEIMEVLSSVETIRQSTLAQMLKMNRSNLSREMNRITEAGFAEERKTQKLKVYCLSPQGAQYCARHPLTSVRDKKSCDERYSRGDAYASLTDDGINYPEEGNNLEAQGVCFMINEQRNEYSYLISASDLEVFPNNMQSEDLLEAELCTRK